MLIIIFIHSFVYLFYFFFRNNLFILILSSIIKPLNIISFPLWSLAQIWWEITYGDRAEGIVVILLFRAFLISVSKSFPHSLLPLGFFLHIGLCVSGFYRFFETLIMAEQVWDLFFAPRFFPSNQCLTSSCMYETMFCLYCRRRRLFWSSPRCFLGRKSN